MAPIALLSVSDKQGIVELAKRITEEFGYEIISSGGTAEHLRDNEITVRKVSDYTGAREILEGRVKTLHPKIHGGILAKRSNQAHAEDLRANKISEIDLVVVNLYPFNETINNPNSNFENAIENIDIGGPTLIRAAAKNHKDVVVLSNPSQYKKFLSCLKAGKIDYELRKKFASEAFTHTAKYDSAISNWFINQSIKNNHSWESSVPLKQTLRYGENPHQKASWYSYPGQGFGATKQLQGKDLSANNLLDLEAALSTVREFGFREAKEDYFEHAAVVIKHTNPCGVAIGNSASEALSKALDADRKSSFGGIVALNSAVDISTANELNSQFLECIIAPYFEEEAKEILKNKKNLRILEIDKEALLSTHNENVRSISGGFLVQDQDIGNINEKEWVTITKKIPTSQERKDLLFSWRLAKHVRSNAIVVAASGQSLGIGAGQMNRIGSAEIALKSAGEKAKGAVLASDGFFPFDDTIELASRFGISSVIQPGGSIRDQECIDKCNDLNISMIFTGKRHFLH